MRRLITILGAAALMLAAMPAIAAEPGPTTYEPKTKIGRPSILKGPNGIFVHPNGNVYAASVVGDEITVQDPNTGKILDRIGPEHGVHGPDDVTIAPDGTIYWTEILGGNVGMLKPDGTWTTQFVAPGVNPITLSDDGRLFVALDFLEDGLYELDPELIDAPELIMPDLSGFNGMDFGPDGLLYGPLFNDGAIARIDVDAAVPSTEIVATGFTTPAAVKFNSRGDLYAVDLAEGSVVKVDIATGESQTIAQVDGVLDNLAFDANDRLFVAATAAGQVLRMNLRGNNDKGHLVGINQTGFAMPGGVAVSPSGTVWVADFSSLRGFDTPRVPDASFYNRFSAPFEGAVWSFTAAADGDNVIITDWFSNAVQVIDPSDGTILEDIRTVPVPTNAIRHGDALVAAAVGTGSVVDANTGDVLISGLFLPRGLASDGDTLYVGDWATGLIWAVLGGGTSIVASGLVTPEGLALDGDRLLVVEEQLGRVTAVDLTNGDKTTLIDGLELGYRPVPGGLPTGAFNGVAVTPDGSIIVPEDIANTVTVYKPSK
jgi:sugar lactone lactonase YvrE